MCENEIFAHKVWVKFRNCKKYENANAEFEHALNLQECLQYSALDRSANLIRLHFFTLDLKLIRLLHLNYI